MLRNQTVQQLREMRLHGMADALEEQLHTTAAHELDFEERLALLVDRELTSRDNRRMARLLKQAKLRLSAAVEDIDFRSSRGLDRPLLLRLASCDWIRAGHNLLVTGPTGTGKSWIACALGQAACRQGLPVRYFRVSRLMGDLGLARADGSYGRFLQQLARTQLLILDDWGMAALKDLERRDVLEILDDRYGRSATLVTSQLPVDHWHEIIGDPTYGDAILDRLIHNAYRIPLKGGSMRKHFQTDPKADDGPAGSTTLNPASLRSD